MKILYLVPHIPNPIKTRSYFQIQGLRDAGHEVVIGSLRFNLRDDKNIRALEEADIDVLSAYIPLYQAGANSLFALMKLQPMQSHFMWSAHLWQKLQEYIQQNPPDIIHVEHLRMAVYGLLLRNSWPVIWDAVDHLSSLYEKAGTASASRVWQLAARVEAPLLKRYEPWLVSQFSATTVISQDDQRAFQRLSDNPERVHVIPHGVPLKEMEVEANRLPKTVIITGALNYHPNVASVLYFVQRIWPRVCEVISDAKLQIVGANPAPNIRALESSQIEVTGFVPSLFDYLRCATVAVAPILYGSGIQIKVIEALLTGTPLVATSVALRGLNLTPMKEVIVADTPELFSQAVIDLLENPAQRVELGKAGQSYIKVNHDLVSTTQQLTHLYTRVNEEHYS